MVTKIKPDTALKDFWRDNARFADLFNAAFFGGETILHPENLAEVDTDVSSVLKFNGHAESVQRIFDVAKKAADGTTLIIFGLENQSKIHYAMPLRHMLGDAFSYLKEYNEIKKKNRNDKSSSDSAEFLSGFKKGDRLHPMISLCIYYGEDPWDGPLSLTDMMDIPESMKTFVSDYKMNLIQVRTSENLSFHHPDVKAVFDISRFIYNKDYDKLRNTYKDDDQNLSSELGVVIGTITGSKKLIDYALEAENKGGQLKMCNALAEWEEECRQKGLNEGLSQGRLEGAFTGRLEGTIVTSKKFNASKEDTIQNIMVDFALSKAEATEYVEKYW